MRNTGFKKRFSWCTMLILCVLSETYENMRIRIENKSLLVDVRLGGVKFVYTGY